MTTWESFEKISIELRKLFLLLAEEFGIIRLEDNMNKHLLYAKYVFKHKYYVLIECWKRGLIWRGIMHDMSKFLPSEWFPYANFFYGKVTCTNESCRGSGRIWIDGYATVICPTCHGSGKILKRESVRDKTGYYKPTDTGDKAFDFAWLLHQKRNRHHWQWWVLPEDEGGVKILPMQEQYRTEMICDWIGAGKAQGTPSVNAWYKKNGHKMQLAPETRNWVEEQLKDLP